MAAFSARRLVCVAISSIALMMLVISRPDWLISCIAAFRVTINSLPPRAECSESRERELASLAYSEVWRICAAIWLMVALISVTAEADSVAPLERSWLRLVTWPALSLISPELCWTWDTNSLRLSTIRLSASPSWSCSEARRTSTSRSPWEMRSATCTCSCRLSAIRSRLADSWPTSSADWCVRRWEKSPF